MSWWGVGDGCMGEDVNEQNTYSSHTHTPYLSMLIIYIIDIFNMLHAGTELRSLKDIIVCA